MNSRKLKTSLFLALILAFCCSAALADDDNHGTDHSKGHSNDAKANCKKPPKPTPPPPPPAPKPDPVTVTTTNTNTNSNTNSNTNTNTNTQSQQQQQQQSQTANGGNASSSASNNGNGSNNNTTNYQAAKNPVSTAYAPPVIPTANCFKGFGGGVQTMPVGVSLGGGKIDPNCRALETARNAPNRVTFCKIYITLKDSKAAGVTMEDCMGIDPQPAAPVVEERKPEVNIYLPPQVAPAEVVKAEEPAPTPKPFLGQIGVCTFSKVVSCKVEKGVTVITPTGVCKQQLQTAKAALDQYPGTVLVIRGNRNPSEAPATAQARATNVQKQLVEYGVSPDRLRTEVGTGTARTVELILGQS
jgi:outer membrane protein OmpA-like peptidoglycan-associated protein